MQPYPQRFPFTAASLPVPIRCPHHPVRNGGLISSGSGRCPAPFAPVPLPCPGPLPSAGWPPPAAGPFPVPHCPGAGVAWPSPRVPAPPGPRLPNVAGRVRAGNSRFPARHCFWRAAAIRECRSSPGSTPGIGSRAWKRADPDGSRSRLPAGISPLKNICRQPLFTSLSLKATCPHPGSHPGGTESRKRAGHDSGLPAAQSFRFPAASKKNPESGYNSGGNVAVKAWDIRGMLPADVF